MGFSSRQVLRCGVVRVTRMTRDDVLRVVREARERGELPDLSYENLRGLNLRGLDLIGADLRYANLDCASLGRANLRGANLYGANLVRANLYDANLYGTRWDGLVIDGLYPYRVLLAPTRDGWHLTIGCWSGTPDELRTLTAQDDGWPEAEGDEITHRRPLLEAALNVVDAHIAGRTHVINDLKERWAYCPAPWMT